MNKLVVYLDQNFASNLAKASKLPEWQDPDKELYLRLLEMLWRKTREDKIICPISDFHRQESERSQRIKGFFWHVLRQLSHDFSINNSMEILWDQIGDAADSYLGKPTSSGPKWQKFFNRDPMISVKDMEWPPETMVHIPTHDELVQFDRYLTNEAGNQYAGYKKNRLEVAGTFEEEFGIHETAVNIGGIFATGSSGNDLSHGKESADRFFSDISGRNSISCY